MKKSVLIVIISIYAFAKLNAINVDSLIIYPNPCDTLTTISFSTSANDTISLELFNIIGQSQHVFYNNSILPVGNYYINYNTALLPNGLYVMRLKINSIMLTKKLIIQHLSTAVNINNYEKEEIKIYPNPLQNFISIESKIGKKIELYNTNGTLVYESNFFNNIDLSHIDIGIYSLLIYNHQNLIIHRQKIIKNE